MKKSKLITLLSSFSKEEMKSFEKFIESPYFNNERNFKPFYHILKIYHPAFDNLNFTEERIFKKLYPGKMFNKNSALTMRVLFSQLSVLAEKFLTIEGFNKNEAFKDTCLLKELHLKKLFDIFLSTKSRIRAENKNMELDNANLLKTFLVESEINGWQKYKSKLDEIQHFDDSNVVEEALIIFFLFQITDINQRWNKDYFKDAERSGLSKKYFEFFDFKSFIESLKDSKELNSVWLQIIYYSNKIESDNNYEEGYAMLKKCFLDNFNNFSLSMKNELLLTLMNYCIFQTKGNRKKYNEDYIKYYKIFVKENLVSMQHEVFGIRQIRNFVRICCRLKRYKEVENFLKTYHDYISINIRNDCINYAKASIQFSKNKFNETLKFLSTINFSIPMMIKDIKMLKLKCLFELSYFDSLRSEVDAYRHFLSNTSLIPKSYLESDKLFMIYLLKLSKIREDNMSDELFSLQIEIEATSLNDNTKWILDKIGILLASDSPKRILEK